jgi:hypothetical protein
MWKFTLTFLFVTAFQVGSAQSNPSKLIVWSADRACGYKNFAVTPDDRPTCESIETPRGKVSVVNYGDISLAVGFLESGDYILAATQLRNRTDMPFEIDTDRWGAAHFEKPEQFYKRERPLLAETSFPSRDIVRGITSGASRDNAADTFMAGISKTGVVKDVRRPDGTRVKSVVISDDVEAVNAANSRNLSRTDKAAANQELIRKNAFTQKWISARGDAKGIVYFRRVKKAELVVFYFRLLDATYVFRLLRNTQ